MTIDLDAYRDEAVQYDDRTRPFQRWRELVVDELPAGPGDTILDVGCGTGLCLPLLHDKVGDQGAVVGIDQSDQMLALAADRVVDHGWHNVHLISAPMTNAP